MIAAHDFRRVLRGGSKARSGPLVVHVAAPEAAASTSPVGVCGFIVPKAVGSAVVRNRVRRQVRHLLMPATWWESHDLVIRVQPGKTSRWTSDQLDHHLRQAYHSAVRRLRP